jgi:hypothetical protein
MQPRFPQIAAIGHNLAVAIFIGRQDIVGHLIGREMVTLGVGSHSRKTDVLTSKTLVLDAIKPTYQVLPKSISTAFPTDNELSAAQERVTKENQKPKNAYDADLALRTRILKADFQLKFVIIRHSRSNGLKQSGVATVTAGSLRRPSAGLALTTFAQLTTHLPLYSSTSSCRDCASCKKSVSVSQRTKRCCSSSVAIPDHIGCSEGRQNARK